MLQSMAASNFHTLRGLGLGLCKIFHTFKGQGDFDIISIIRSACSIELEEMVILTGGLDHEEEPTTRVTVYNKNGFLADWPHLQTSRDDHGCGHFINADKEVVRQ